MSEANLEKVLIVYTHFKTMPGEALVSDHFLGIGRLRHWNAHDLQDGIDEAYRIGWVEKGKLGWRLTKAGFEAASSLSRHAPGRLSAWRRATISAASISTGSLRDARAIRSPHWTSTS